MSVAQTNEEACIAYDKIYPSINETEDVIVLNVGGVRHEVFLKTLQKFPDSRLGNLSSSTAKKYPTDEFYFDRNPIIFNFILDFFRTGKLHFNDEICANSFCDELEFWMLSEGNLSPCCKEKYYMKKLQATREIKEETKAEEIKSQLADLACGIFLTIQVAPFLLAFTML